MPDHIACVTGGIAVLWIERDLYSTAYWNIGHLVGAGDIHLVMRRYCTFEIASLYQHQAGGVYAASCSFCDRCDSSGPGDPMYCDLEERR